MVKTPGKSTDLEKWKPTLREAYVTKIRSEAAQEGEEKPFGGSVAFEGKNNKKQKKGAHLTH